MSHARPAPVIDLVAVRAAEARLDRLLTEHPELRERTAAMLAGELACPDLENEPMSTERPTTLAAPINLRLPQPLIDRAQELVSVAHAAPELATSASITRADVLRLACLRGIRELEAELGARQQQLPLD